MFILPHMFILPLSTLTCDSKQPAAAAAAATALAAAPAYMTTQAIQRSTT